MRTKPRRRTVLSFNRFEMLEPRTLLSITPNDLYYPQEWGLNNSNNVDIDAPEAWAINTGSSSLIVAAIGVTGVDLTNPDLANRIWTNPSPNSDPNYPAALHGWNYETNSPTITDTNGHDTNVAGIVAAQTNNNQGIAGVTWGCQFMPLVANTIYEDAAAVDFAVAHGAKVINMSFGYAESSAYFASDALYQAIQRAANSGVVCVAAAGNDGTPGDTGGTGQDLGSLTYTVCPAAFRLPNMINVAAVDSSGNLTSWSNYGATTVDLAAPGSNIYTTGLQGGYISFAGGTSFAAPFVTGVVALVESQHPEYTAQQVVQRVVSTTKPLASLNGKTISGGMVDAYNALLAGLPSPPSNVAAAAAGPTQVSLSWTASPSSGVTGYKIERSTDQVNWSQIAVAPSSPTTYSDSALSASTNYFYRIRATSSAGDSLYSSTASATTGSGTILTRAIIDDSSGSGFSTTATGGISWQSWTGYGYAGTHKTAGGAGVGQAANATASWTFNVTPGLYEVWTTWVQDPHRAVNAPFTIYDGTTTLATVAVDETQIADGYYNAGFSWTTLGERFQVSGNTLTIKLTNQGVDNSQYVVADAVRINKTGPFYVDESSGAVKTGSWTTWTGQGYSNTHATAAGAGTGTTTDSASTSWNFSNLAAGSYEVWVTWIADPHRATNAPFTVSNGATVAGSKLVNQTASPTGYYAQGYTWSTLGIYQITTSNEQTATDGVLTVLLGNHGVDASQYIVADAVRINRVGPFYVDDGDSTGFARTNGLDGATWTQWRSGNNAPEGFDHSHSTAPAGDGTTTATWKFDNLLPGVYEVWATWVQAPNRATNSPFSIYDGNTKQGAIIYEDQTLTPNDGIHFDYGSSWVVLGGNFNITTGTLKVVLTNQGIALGRYIVADAIRVNRVGDLTGGGGVIESFAVQKAPSLADHTRKQAIPLPQPVVPFGSIVDLKSSADLTQKRGPWVFGQPMPASSPRPWSVLGQKQRLKDLLTWSERRMTEPEYGFGF